MYKHLIVAVALDHERDKEHVEAMEIARRLCAEGGKITALHVMEALPSYATQYLPADHLETYQADTRAALQQYFRDAPDVTPVVVVGHAGRSIVEYAQEHKADCIVIASHRPGLQDYFLGSTAARVVRHAACAVHVIR